MGSADWTTYRLCPVCRSVSGVACKSLSGKVVNGHPDGHEYPLSEPHKKRELRKATYRGTSELARAIYQEDRRRVTRTDA